jgi:hypothetical protein
LKSTPWWVLVFSIGSAFAAIAIMGRLANKALARLTEGAGATQGPSDAGSGG